MLQHGFMLRSKNLSVYCLSPSTKTLIKVMFLCLHFFVLKQKKNCESCSWIERVRWKAYHDLYSHFIASLILFFLCVIFTFAFHFKAIPPSFFSFANFFFFHFFLLLLLLLFVIFKRCHPPFRDHSFHSISFYRDLRYFTNKNPMDLLW